MSLAALDADAEARTHPDFIKMWKQAADGVATEASPVSKPARTGSRYRHLLTLRFVLTNLTALALLIAFEAQGWISAVIMGDETRLTLVILGVFFIGLASAGWKIWDLSRALNAAENPKTAKIEWIARYVEQATRKDAGARGIAGSVLRMQLANRIGSVKHVANSLVLLGLIGTVIGFIIALSGVNAESAADASAIAPMVGDLIRGMSVALFTTLAGAALNLWLMINFHMLAGGATRLAGRMVEAAEDAALEAANAHT